MRQTTALWLGILSMSKLIAFAGYAGAGKDEAAIPLIQLGYTRKCFGDIIKRQLDPLIKTHFGFSAFTSNRTEKALIRRTLESWGEDNYEAIMAEYFKQIPERTVNTRLVRSREAQEWREHGGIVVLIERPGANGATDWERDRLKELYRASLIDRVICNRGGISELHQQISELAA